MNGVDLVEAYLEHSKTGFSRYLDMAGVTQTSGIEVAKIVRDYWKLASFRTVSTVRAGVRVTLDGAESSDHVTVEAADDMLSSRKRRRRPQNFD